MPEEPQNNGVVQIPLDGSYGCGPTCELTIITRISETSQLREETYEVPYWLIHTNRLQAMNDMNFIAGYRIVKGEKTPPALKDLGLS